MNFSSGDSRTVDQLSPPNSCTIVLDTIGIIQAIGTCTVHFVHKGRMSSIQNRSNMSSALELIRTLAINLERIFLGSKSNQKDSSIFFIFFFIIFDLS